jgi:F-type H+-transporting ATPase subunit b
MDQLLRQVGELLLSSIPTIIGLLVVWAAYRTLVFNKLEQVLAQRHARTEGAMEKAKAEIVSALARTAEYEQKLREARAHIFKIQEAHRKQILDQRTHAITVARKRAEEMVKNAHAEVEQEVAAAKAGLPRHAEALADQIIQTVLRPAVAAGGR